MARPSKLTNETEKAICDAIRDGATYAAASEAAGIAYATFNEWMKDERPRFVKFSEAVQEANGHRANPADKTAWAQRLAGVGVDIGASFQK
jgi:hypothetical protein